MKKIIALTSCFVLLGSGMALAEGTALAVKGVSDEAKSIYGGIDATDAAGGNATLIGKLSKGSRLSPNHSATGYALVTKHSSGNTLYGTAHDATAIYKKETTTGQLTTADAPSAASYSSFDQWTAM